jgi:cytidylate kinase
MSVITISREYGCGGDEVVGRVCEILGYRSFNKYSISESYRSLGFSIQDFTDFTEDEHKVQSFFERFFMSLGKAQVIADDPYYTQTLQQMDIGEESSLPLVQKAVIQAYDIGNFVIVGRGGQVLLRDKPGALHVRLIAPIEDRIQRVKNELKRNQQDYDASIDIRRNAQNLIEKRDNASADYIKRYYDCRWDDPSLYHIVINTGKINAESAAWIIAQTIALI